MQKPITVLVDSPCPPTVSQWAAVRIKAYLVDRGNPQVTPGAIPPLPKTQENKTQILKNYV